MTLNPDRPRIRRRKRSNGKCGPVALSAVTGFHVDGIVRWLRAHRVWMNSSWEPKDHLPLRIGGIAIVEAKDFLIAQGFDTEVLEVPDIGLDRLHHEGRIGDGLFLVWLSMLHVIAWWRHTDATDPGYPDDWKTGLVFSNDFDWSTGACDGVSFRMCPYRSLPAHQIWRIKKGGS